MTKEEAKQQFDDVTEFTPPLESNKAFASAVRCIDREAGVVLYGVENAGRTGGGLGISVIPLSETALDDD